MNQPRPMTVKNTQAGNPCQLKAPLCSNYQGVDAACCQNPTDREGESAAAVRQTTTSRCQHPTTAAPAHFLPQTTRRRHSTPNKTAGGQTTSRSRPTPCPVTCQHTSVRLQKKSGGTAFVYSTSSNCCCQAKPSTLLLFFQLELNSNSRYASRQAPVGLTAACIHTPCQFHGHSHTNTSLLCGGSREVLPARFHTCADASHLIVDRWPPQQQQPQLHTCSTANKLQRQMLHSRLAAARQGNLPYK